MDDFKDSKTALVADVDCTAEGKSLCDKNDVRGYPSIKWGDPNDLKEYNGGRTLDDLRKFAEENLGPTCGPDNLDLCDEADKKLIAKYMKWDVDELDLSIEENEQKVAKIEAKFTKSKEDMESKVRALQGKIEKETKKKEDSVAKEQKKHGYKYMKAVQASRKKGADPDEDPDLKDDDDEDAKKDGEKKEEL